MEELTNDEVVILKNLLDKESKILQEEIRTFNQEFKYNWARMWEKRLLKINALNVKFKQYGNK